MVKKSLSANQVEATSKVSGLVLANALIFQEVLSLHFPRIMTLEKAINNENLIGGLAKQWDYIINEIDYFPIFHIAKEIIVSLSSTPDILEGLKTLIRTAQSITGNRAGLSHDLMGRVYHKLLVDAKYLGTFYTSIPAATLLLRLALNPDSWEIQWDSLDDIKELRIADLACGTGTLLVASAEAVSDNHVSRASSEGSNISFDELQSILSEEVLYGYDVLPSALHLTASTLALRAPNTAFKLMNLFSLPLGGETRRLGSIEFLRGKFLPMEDLFGAIPKTEQVSGESKGEANSASLPLLDLCVMNPPFTRSVGGNLLFGSLPKQERKLMQRDLQKLVKPEGIYANITAGLGSVFVATAHPFINEGGRIALVLPKTLLSGSAWQKTRELLEKFYALEYIIVSHDPVSWNFSESTSLSEVLVIARKKSEEQAPGNVRIVNLWRNPSTSFEALAISSHLRNTSLPVLTETSGVSSIELRGEKVFEAFELPFENLIEKKEWYSSCAFAQFELVKLANNLQKGRLKLPGQKSDYQLPLAELGKQGKLGPDRRDIYDAFNQSDNPNSYRAFWGHDANEVKQIKQDANKYLEPLSKAKKDRNLKKVSDVWPLASRLLIAEGLRLSTQRLVSVELQKLVLSNVWWTFRFTSLDSARKRRQAEKAMALWLNSTLGLVSLFSTRGETEGPWVNFKKPGLKKLMVPDMGRLGEKKLGTLAKQYTKLSSLVIEPFPNMAVDKNRKRIDEAISAAFGLPDLSLIREMLGREPGITDRRI